MADNPHIGHRQRMRRKLFDYSRRVFDTYELLEMLLYYSVKLRDTNPVSKALLQRFSSLNGVLHAEYSELISVDGVGEKSARLICGVNRLHKALFSEENRADSSVMLCLCDLFELIGAKESEASRLTQNYLPKHIFELDGDTLRELIGESLACFILIISALLSRRITDKYAKQRHLCEKDIKNYLIGLFFGLPYENIYMLSFSANGEFISADFISEGILNGSEILPKKIITVASKRQAPAVSLAHNHPMASAEPSDDDMATTALVSNILKENGITLYEHYTVSANQVIKITK